MAYTTIDDPSKYFQTLLYSGNASDSRALTNDGNSDLQPDLVWIKERSSTSAHKLLDSTRGVGKALGSNTDSVEESFAFLSSFDSDGFTIGTSDGSTNASGDTYVAWQWKANGGTETASSTEGSGALTSSAQADTTAKFSIVTYTGSGTSGHTFVHGLGSVPKWIMLKSRSDADVWHTFHQDAYRSGDYNQWQTITKLNLTNASDHGANSAWSDTAATTSDVTVGNGDACNEDGDNFVAYCWDEVQGFSKFGGYTGNGNADGPFIYTGFKPAWVMVRRTNTTGAWEIYDSARNGNDSNPINDRLRANENAAEDTDDTSDYVSDFLSNGWKIRTNSGNWNTDEHKYIYIAFAEHPFVSSEGVPTTAR